MKVNILGTEYTIVETNNIKEGFDGECNFYFKTIKIKPLGKLLDEAPLSEKRIRRKEILRHELIHAMFHEAGLDNYADDEILVDWIAVQFDKICAIIKLAGG